MKEKTLFIFAGPNGSGKSSLVKSVLERYPSLYYICADDIERLVFSHIEDPGQRSREALLLAETAIAELIDRGAFCGYETVLSSDHKWKILERARAREMAVVSYFIATGDVEINCRRVAARVLGGGHPVPPEKIRSRYEKSISRLPKLLRASDICFVFDNSEESPASGPRLLMLKKGQSIWYDPAVQTDFHWLRPCLMELGVTPGFKVTPTKELVKHGLGIDRE